MVGTALRAVRSQTELRMSTVLTAGSESPPYPTQITNDSTQRETGDRMIG